MNFININKQSQVFNLKEALLCNQSDNGLIMPQYLPEFGDLFIRKINRKTNLEIASDLLYPYLSSVMDWTQLPKY